MICWCVKFGKPTFLTHIRVRVNDRLRDGPLMIWRGGGGLGQKQEKKLNCYLRGKKDSTVCWPGKTQHKFSARAPPGR